MKHFWMAVSICCLSGAAIALWRHRIDAAFVIAAIGALAWFLNYRAQMKSSFADPPVGIHHSRDASESNED